MAVSKKGGILKGNTFDDQHNPTPDHMFIHHFLTKNNVWGKKGFHFFCNLMRITEGWYISFSWS